MKKQLVAFVCSVLCCTAGLAQYAEVYPSNWWVGMKWNKVQLMLYNDYDEFNQETVRITYPGVKIEKVHKVENGSYIFVDVSIAATAKPGNVSIELISGGKAHVVSWPLKSRTPGKGTTFAQGINSSDFIYLLMPDRFSNGDPSNDRIEGMKDQTLDRDSIYHRHGGDFAGIINHLDYLKDLGVTALWMTPVIENDMPERTEHGYAFTNHYKIEPRFGGAKMYKMLGQELHKRGMKLVQDAVYNHVGVHHFTVTDPPMKDWLHQWPSFTQTTYKDQPLYDPYAAEVDKRKMLDGWFTRHMPDLNQDNPFVANYLIQHALWCVEEFGVDGWRIDTYPYNDLDFMNRCNKALMDEYPKMTMFGETWVHGVAAQAYFTRNKTNTAFKSNLPSVTDFQTNLYGIIPALTEKFGWTEGVNKLYSTLAGDYLYENPMNNVNFLDNHDKSRIYSVVNEDLDKQKMGIGWLLTTRGIPQMYYGTEVLMKGHTNPDGWVRLDFPGGWKGDSKSAFTKDGLDDREIEAQEWTKKIANYRKSSSAIKTGKLMQYVPDDGLYVYFRYDGKQTVMCIMNTSDKAKTVEFSKYPEMTKGIKSVKNITGEQPTEGDSFLVEPKQMMILELVK
ncbi:MAG: alpha-amylase [Chitinophagaceae bacterium]|nr:alpha-amylase [Chitinophagaceae bacterium]